MARKSKVRKRDEKLDRGIAKLLRDPVVREQMQQIQQIFRLMPAQEVDGLTDGLGLSKKEARQAKKELRKEWAKARRSWS